MNNNTDLSTFTFQNVPVRTFIIGDEIWFVVSDACKVLDIRNVSDATSRLDQDGVASTDIVDSLGKRQNMTIANEPNLYQLIFRSDKPNAKAFQNWVYRDVLPSIRKTGNYAIQHTQSKELEHLRKEVREIKQLISAPEKQHVSRKELKQRVMEAIQDMQEDYPDGVTTSEINEGYPWFSQRNYSNPQIWHIIDKLIEKGLLQQNQVRRQVAPNYSRIEWRFSLTK